MPDSGGSSPEQASQRPQLVVADRFGRVVETRQIPQPPKELSPEPTTQIADVLVSLKEEIVSLREAISPTRRGEQSEFEKVVAWHEFYKRKDPASLTGEERNGLDQTKEVLDQLIQEAQKQGILRDVKRYASSFYSSIRAHPPEDRLLHLRQAKIPQFEEAFWTHSRHRGQTSKFKGIRDYYFSAFWESFENDLEGVALDRNQDIADREYLAVKDEGEEARLKEPKFRRERGSYVDEFHWAENLQEMEMSVHEWLASVEEELPEESAGKVADFIGTKRGEGLGMLSRLRVRLNADFGLEIKAKDLTYTRMRKLIEARLNVLGGQLVNRGGWEHYIAYLGDFAVNFVDHYDALYLEDSLVPIALHKLSDRDGIYWRGCEPDRLHRPLTGQIKDFQNQLDDQMIDLLATHELVLKTRVERTLRLLKTYSKEELAQKGLPDNVASRSYDEQYGLVFAYERDEFVRTNLAFQKTRQRYDAEEGLGGLTDEERARRIREIIAARVQQVEPRFLSQLSNDEREQDKQLWEWVGRHNKGRFDKWYPSKWDRMRLSIDRPEKVLARVLSKGEFESMYEEVNLEGLSTREIEEVMEKRRERAMQVLGVAKRTQIFFGVASRYGGTRLRITDENGNTITTKPRFAEVRDRLKKLIEEDATKPLEQQKFRVHHALKKLGLANNLPMWSSYLANDDTTTAWFSETMGIPADEKQELIALVEEERRQLRAVEDQVAEEFMKGKTKEGWRKRINYTGGNIDLRKIWDARYMFSTSGGVLAPDLVPYIDLGIYDMLWEMGCEDFREFTGWVKRRDEVEVYYQPVWNVLDPIDYHRRLNEAEMLRKALAGFTTKEGKKVSGFLNSPLGGAYKLKGAFIDRNIINSDMANCIRFHNAVAEAGDVSAGELERLRQGTYDDFDSMTPVARDKFFELCMERLQPLIEVMENRSYVENRLVNKEDTSNYLYDNTLLWYAFRRWLRTSSEYAKKFNFAPHARTELAIRFYQISLEELHLILPKEERSKLFPAEEARVKSDTVVQAAA